MTIWTIAIALLAFAALVLLTVGLRGRRLDDHPVCRKCRFDLSGVAIEAPEARCPECGRTLHARRAIRIGRRRKRRSVIVAGALALLLALAGGAGLGWSSASGFNWNTLKPVWLLRIDANSADQERAGAALTELARRIDRGGLSHAAAEELAREGLVRQADDGAPWPRPWGEVIEAAWRLGALPDAALEQYVRRGLEGHFRFEARDSVRQGDSIPYRVNYFPTRNAFRSSLTFAFKRIEIRIDGEPVAPGDAGWFGMSLGASTMGHWDVESDAVSLDVGRHTLSVAWRALITVKPGVEDPFMNLSDVFEKEFEVLPASAETIELVYDPSLRSAMEDALEIRRLSVERVDGILRARGSIYFNDPPVPVAVEIFWRSGDREWRVGSVASPMGGLGTGMGTSVRGALPGFDTDRVDLIFRPSREVALKTAAVHRIWGGDIVVQDVPVQWEDER